MPDLLIAGPADAAVTFLMSHGAGAPMDSTWMNGLCDRLTARGMRVVRFEFPYMAARRSGQRKPPPRAETLRGEFSDAIEAVGTTATLLIGGKSMGGRVASLVAGDLHAAGSVAGLVCLGYPFHPPGDAGKLRTAHLESLSCPTLICQGERDPFGTRKEVAAYRLSDAIAIEWLKDGDHDLKPRKGAGTTLDANLAAAADRIVDWAASLSSAARPKEAKA